jgi:tetratricopeptide (TPR) repeat protein
MPQTKMFKAGSIIYFEKDKADSVFLLKEGKINLIYDDISLGEKVTDAILAGEFFGVKSGLIRYPREETAKVVLDSIVIEFSVNEFEALIMKNTKIILKMMKAFSTQLRKIGKQVQSMVSSKVVSEPSDEFFHIGEYYLKNKKYKQAMTVYQRYKKYYPDGRYSILADKRFAIANSALNSYGEGGGPNPILDEDTTLNFKKNEPQVKSDHGFEDQEEMDDIFKEKNNQSEGMKQYYKGVSFMSQGKYIDAFNTFKKVIALGNEEEKLMSSFEIGKCFYYLNKFNECITHFNNLLGKNPGFNEKAEVLYFIGLSYAQLKDTDNAINYFQEVLEYADQNDNIYRKAQKALKEI